MEKSPEVIRPEEHVILLAVLIHLRREKRFDVDRCTEDLDDVLLALKTTGHCLIPRGAIDALKTFLSQFGTFAQVLPKE
jgi:hypothetical protein